MNDSDWNTTWHTLGKLIGSKWSCHVLRLLGREPYGFNELRRELDGLTATMLSRRLKELRCHGLVERTVKSSPPLETRYELTAAGREFTHLLGEMEDLVRIREQSEETICCETESDETDERRCVSGGGAETCLTLTS